MSTLRQGVADLVATCLDDRPWNTPDDLAKGVFTGLERLAQGYWPRRWMGRRVGLVTNHTGRTTDGRSAASVLASHDHVVLAALFSPEHGLYGTVDEKVGHAVDAETGLRVWSLYGEVRKPSKEMLEGLDILVFDIQDIGTRFYTYLSTLTNCMEAAHENGLAVCVLDRPNPIGGVDVEGPLADAASLDFVGIHPLPIRHGMTMGELALMIAAERGWTIELEVVWMKGWQRRMLFDETGIAWVDPSPNMRSLEAALIYPGLGILETTNLSVGRGTDSPFEIVGAPWFPADAVKTRLDAAGLPGVAFEPVVFRPSASKFRGERCRGLRLSVLDRATFRPVAMAMTLAVALRTEAPEAWDRGRLDRLLKSKAVLASVEQSVWPTVPDSETPASFALRRARFLSYD